jgi:hypothetical protein
MRVPVSGWVKKRQRDIRNDPRTIAEAKIPENILGKKLFPRLISRNPASGRAGISQAY